MKLRVVGLFLVPLALAVAQAPKPDSCTDCHSVMEGAIQAPAIAYKADIHAAAGITCADCHGGNPAVSDPEGAMNRAKGFIGKPARTAIPKLCSNCHSNADYMGKHKPQQRVDQFAQYQTSVHGKRLAAGDTNVATCVDCHSVHNIRGVRDALSPVHPVNLPDTCGHCHADAGKMSQYGIPTNQHADYKTSVHWSALKDRGDLSAPNCASCHGNHGAKPPGAESVTAVCANCHVMFGQLFSKSVHQPVFSEGGGCTVCHSNHAIKQPSTAMLKGKDAVCATCHDAGTPGAKAAEEIAGLLDGLAGNLNQSREALAKADRYGMEVSEAQLKLAEGHESLIKARLTLHSFQLEEVRKTVAPGMKIASETRTAGENALREKDFRRIGLGISVLFIALTVIAIAVLLRRMESRSNNHEEGKQTL